MCSLTAAGDLVLRLGFVWSQKIALLHGDRPASCVANCGRNVRWICGFAFMRASGALGECAGSGRTGRVGDAERRVPGGGLCRHSVLVVLRHALRQE